MRLRVVLVTLSVAAVAAAGACGDAGPPPPPPPPASAAVHDGDGQAGEAGAVLAESLAVIVRDERGRPLRGVTVVWAVGEGGGSVSPATSVTGQTGVARAARTLGPTAGPQTAMASVHDLDAVTFDAVARVQGGVNMGARTIGPLTDTTLGTNDQPLVVMVTDEHGAPVPGVVVAWTASGGGSVSAAAMPTDAGGESIVHYTYGPTAGEQFARASVPGLVGSPIDFTLRATAGDPVTLEKSGGDGLAVPAGGMVVHTVTTRDARGNARNGATVQWAVAQGGGSITPAQNITGGEGTASATRTLGSAAGAQTATARAPDLPGAPQVTFTTTATAATAAPRGHSARNETAGSTRLARRAGTQQASRATAARSAATAPKVSGSAGATP